MSFLSRMYTETCSAISDAYVHFVHGDDAGKSATLVFIARPQFSNNEFGDLKNMSKDHHKWGSIPGTPLNGKRTSDPEIEAKFDLGLTFLRINDRAYVHTVHPSSDASRCGIQPRDCVQFASVFSGKGLEEYRDDVSRATMTALDYEKRGRRTGYDEFRELFEGCCRDPLPLPNNVHDEYSSPIMNGGQYDINCSSSGNEIQNIPYLTSEDNMCILQHDLPLSIFELSDNHNPSNQMSIFSSPIEKSIRSTTQTWVKRCSPHQYRSKSNVLPHDINGNAIHPVIIIFRRTRKREFGFSTAPLPSLRLDDECNRAACLIRKLAPTIDTEPQPDTWDEIVHDATEYLLPSGSILPPLNSGVEVELNYEITSNNSNYYHHYRDKYDNDRNGTDRFVGVKGVFGEMKRGREGGGGTAITSVKTPRVDKIIPLDTEETQSNLKISRVRSRMYADALRRRTASATSSLSPSCLPISTNVSRGETDTGPSSKHIINSTVLDQDDLEATTIRSMIRSALGLAFVRTSKVVLGVSVHGGSGIVIARLPDGTWSAPSAIGMYGVGLGLQFGLEVADYIFVLQTRDALAHFRHGGNFTIGGNVGAAVAGMGRGAYGAASLNGEICGADVSAYDSPDSLGRVGDGCSDDQVSELAPIVAYAKSQGLYIGVSLEGSKIYSRDDINARTYKFAMGRDVTTNDILTGKVPTPPEAEDLYASLHSVEFTHEIWGLPRPPEILRNDLLHEWVFDRSTLTASSTNEDGVPLAPFSFLSNISPIELQEFSDFETKFKKYLYGGVSVQRLVPDASMEVAAAGKTRRERRTLWLMLPEVGALRLGFISKLNDGGNAGDTSNSKGSDRRKKQHGCDDCSEYSEQQQPRRLYDYGTLASEGETTTLGETTLDDTTFGETTFDTKAHGYISEEKRAEKLRKVRLSNKHSIALTDITQLSQYTDEEIHYSPDDEQEHLRVISVKDVLGGTLLFLANNFREAELLACGLKLLIERETARLGVRGGVPITQLGGLPVCGAMSPENARGQMNLDRPDGFRYSTQQSYFTDTTSCSQSARWQEHSLCPSAYMEKTGYVSSENEEDEESMVMKKGPSVTQWNKRKIPESHKIFQLPTNNYLSREVSCYQRDIKPKAHEINSFGALSKGCAENGKCKYVYGQSLNRDISSDVYLPLPLPMCRVLLLDSCSPVMKRWEGDRGDTNYTYRKWSFPHSTPRELERQKSEHQLIANGSMMAGFRTVSFDRLRNGQRVNLSEMYIVDVDDKNKLSFVISESMPRRGFCVKVKVLLYSVTTHSCEVMIMSDLTPVGKNMSNQSAIDKALFLVINELKVRYGTNDRGLLGGFLDVAHNIQFHKSMKYINLLPNYQQYEFDIPLENQIEQGKVKNNDEFPLMTRTVVGRECLDTTTNEKKSKYSQGISSFDEVINSELCLDKKTKQKHYVTEHNPERPRTKIYSADIDRPPTPSMLDRMTHEIVRPPQQKNPLNNFKCIHIDEHKSSTMTIEVKPLPKLRLSLMPAPREEDEENDSTESTLMEKSRDKDRFKKKSRHKWK